MSQKRKLSLFSFDLKNFNVQSLFEQYFGFFRVECRYILSYVVRETKTSGERKVISKVTS